MAEKKKIIKMVYWADIADPLKLQREMTHQLTTEVEKKENQDWCLKVPLQRSVISVYFQAIYVMWS